MEPNNSSVRLLRLLFNLRERDDDDRLNASMLTMDEMTDREEAKLQHQVSQPASTFKDVITKIDKFIVLTRAQTQGPDCGDHSFGLFFFLPYRNKITLDPMLARLARILTQTMTDAGRTWLGLPFIDFGHPRNARVIRKIQIIP